MVAWLRLASAVEFQAWDSREVLEALPRASQRPYNLSFIHIPKTGGTSMRWGLPAAYLRTFSWGRAYSNSSCNVSRASRFHTTVDESVRCGIVDGEYWRRHFVACTVRDPTERAVSELRFNYKGNLTRFRLECARAKPTKVHDTFAHCRPQVDFLYGHDGAAVCDVVLANPATHAHLLRAMLNVSVPRHRVNPSPSVAVSADVLRGLRSWLNRSAIRHDFDDPIIQEAVRGKVVFPKTPRSLDNGNLWIPFNLPDHDFVNPYFRVEEQRGKQGTNTPNRQHTKNGTTRRRHPRTTTQVTKKKTTTTRREDHRRRLREEEDDHGDAEEIF